MPTAGWGWGGGFKNTYELLSLRALKISILYKNHIFQCVGKIFCVEFQRVPLKFHTKCLTHTLEGVGFIHRFFIHAFLKCPPDVTEPDSRKPSAGGMHSYRKS